MNDIKETIELVKSARKHLVGFYFIHFKGDVYLVKNVGINTENEEPMVIYENANDSNLVWTRTLKEFTSEVDHKKYPDVKQKMRFERIDVYNN